MSPEFFLYLPCGSGRAVFEHFLAKSSLVCIPLAQEEEGVAILGGLSLAKRRAVMMIQDTGLGNAMTALTTFARAYHVPLFIVATRTGGGREINSAVHDYSDRLPQMLTAAGLHHELLDARLPVSRWAQRLVDLQRYAHVSHQPVIALVDLRWD
mgnify:CR=1 FL=1